MGEGGGEEKSVPTVVPQIRQIGQNMYQTSQSTILLPTQCWPTFEFEMRSSQNKDDLAKSGSFLSAS